MICFHEQIICGGVSHRWGRNMIRASSLAIAVLTMFSGINSAFAETTIWDHPYNKLSSFEARGWTENDFRATGCEPASDDLRVCRYLLLDQTIVSAFANGRSDNVSGITVECLDNSRCNRQAFNASVLYVLRSVNEDTDDMNFLLLASTMANRTVTTAGIDFAALGDKQGLLFAMALSAP